MTKKYFAIRWKNGNKVLEYDTWDEVSKKVIGVKGVTFKGFTNKIEAKRWLAQDDVPYRRAGDPYKEDVLYIFVDGSYSSTKKLSGWGWVAVLNGKKIAEDSGVIINPPESRNICGELEATIQATRWYIKRCNYLNHLYPVIVHDYSGISNWALGYWEARKKIAINYVTFMQSHAHLFKFEKVGGHSGISWNDYADKLTRKNYDNIDI